MKQEKEILERQSRRAGVQVRAAVAGKETLHASKLLHPMGGGRAEGGM